MNSKRKEVRVAKWGKCGGIWALRGVHAAYRASEPLVAVAGWTDVGRVEVQAVSDVSIAHARRPVVPVRAAAARISATPVPGENEIIRVFAPVIGSGKGRGSTI